MATGRLHKAMCRLIEDDTLNLEHKASHEPDYSDLVVSADTLMVIDGSRLNLRLHRCHDGKFLATSHKLESNPRSICLISNTEVAVFLEKCKIEILSFKVAGDTGDIIRVRMLYVNTEFDSCNAVAKVKSMDKLVVSGMKLDRSLNWCVLSLKNGHVDTCHQICEWGLDSHLTIKYNMVYISCFAGPDSRDTGVYAYDIHNPHIRKFLYQHSDLKEPRHLTADTKGFIFVCNRYPRSAIHQMTDRGEPVIVHTLSWMPHAIFYEDQHRVLYITSWGDSRIKRYRLEYLHQQCVPKEILNMDDRSIQLFEEALKDGKETVYSIRVMVVGHMGVGKTTLIKRLLGEEVNISEGHKTEGIDVHVSYCDVSLSTREWTQRKKNSEQDYQLQRLATVLNEQQSTRDKIADDDKFVILPQEGRTDTSASVIYKEQDVIQDNETEVLYQRSSPQGFGKVRFSTDGHQQESSSNLVQRKLTQSETSTMAMLKLLQENADKLKQDTDKNSPLTLWDIAGQNAFFTTHQIFLTRRAIYLLVSDISRELTNLVADEDYFDSKGMLKCRFHEMIEVWLNSIHSCAPSPEAGIPPVVLVGTHVDKIVQKQLSTTEFERETILPITSMHAATDVKQEPMTVTFLGSFNPLRKKQRIEVSPASSMTGAHAIVAQARLKKKRKSRFQSKRQQKIIKLDAMASPSMTKAVGERIVDADAEKSNPHVICKRYFKEIRTYLKDKPARFHLIDEDFAIDNTVVDRKLEDLRRTIVEVASQQPYWGEEIPSRWLLLEHALMRRKAAGDKVISRTNVEVINKESTVRIENSEEMDLFLRFLHETGKIIYFSIKVLRENIVLDPMWLIDAIKHLINAQPNLPKSPADNGFQSISPADNDADSAVTQRWSDFKEKGILTLEIVDAAWTKEKNPELHGNRDHLLLIMEQLSIITKSRSFNWNGEMAEDYYLTPFMLRQEAPREIISPEQDSQMVSTPVLCWVFTGKFMPPPVFHRLLAACLARWPVTKKKETSEHLIFYGCCVFDLDPFHKLTVHFKNHVVFARITRMLIDEVKTPNEKLCSIVRKFITMNLSKITSYLGQNLQYELCVQCPPSQGVAEDGTVCFSPFQMWFADKQKMGPAKQEQIYSSASDLTTPEECQMSLGRRALPPGLKYHVFFSYSNSDIVWVKETVERLEKEHGFVCCEHNRDSIPGTQLLQFADDSIRHAYKTVVVMTTEALQNVFVLYVIQRALTHGRDKMRKCVTPVLLEDCEIPGHLSVLNYVDVRDPKKRDIWWPKLLMELDIEVELANSLKIIEKNAKFSVWLGTDLAKHKIIFVCLYQGVMQKTIRSYMNIDICYKDSETPTRPLELPHKMPTDSEMSLGLEDSKLLQQAIDKHGLALFKQHSNLEAITGSSFMLSKSKGCIKCPSLVLYCRVKGIAPFGEVAFPTTLTTGDESLNVLVDVREGYFRQGMFQQSTFGRTDWHEQLRMGISLGIQDGNQGTLGPFVKINATDQGFVTCAHVIVSDPRDQSALKQSEGLPVFQPADGESHPSLQKSREARYCGEVSRIVFHQEICDPINGLSKKVGVDAALVTVKGNRRVDFRSFPFIPDRDMKNAGKPPRYGHGKIQYPLKFEQVQGSRVIKYGATTGLTKGTVLLDGTMVKIQDAVLRLPVNQEKIIMKGQYIVENQGRKSFFELGDSGAGVFLVDAENKLTCLGLAIGCLDQFQTVVTPIEYVLKALRLGLDAMEFDEDMNVQN